MSLKNINNIIKVDMEFYFEDEDDFVDEDDLLELAPPVVYPTNKRAEPGTCPPKGCKNCTCGKADKKNDEEITSASGKADKNEEITSACGNCYLGDGFRCASCPSKGLPPFEPGQKVLIKDKKFESEAYIKFRYDCFAQAYQDGYFNYN